MLSAEIIAITLGTVAGQGIGTQLAVLAGIAVLMTVGVYGFVAGIVKLDDLGLWLTTRPRVLSQAFGRALLAFAPWLMKALSVAGTVAMFLVGGGILVHGVPALHHLIEGMVAQHGVVAKAVLPTVADGLVGLVAGAIVLAAVTAFQRLRGAKAGPPPTG